MAAPVGATDSASADGRQGGLASQELLLLEVQINGVALADVVLAERLRDGRLALPADAWAEARLRPTEPLALSEGGVGYALDTVFGLTYQLNRDRLALAITAPAAAFEASTLGLGRAPAARTTPSPLGAYVNYNLSYAQTANSPFYAAALEGVMVGPWGSMRSRLLVRAAAAAESPAVVRTDTYWRRGLSGRMETIIIGDTIGGGGAWSRPVRYAGIRYARDFGLAPSYVSYPLPTLRGSAALPSTVDVLVNNHRRQAGVQVAPGAFELTDVPVVTGAGEVNLIVRDLLGVEHVISRNYYLSPRLLAPGLSDFAFEAGALRLDYGVRSNHYGDSFAAATYRYGVNAALTVEGRTELAADRQAAGVELSTRLGTLGALRGAAAWSQVEDDSSRRWGGRYMITFERTAPRGGGSVTWEHFDRGFQQFGAFSGEAHPRSRLQLGAGIGIGPGVSVGASYVSQSTWEGDNFALASLTLSAALPGQFHLSAYGSDNVRGEGWSGGLTLSRPLGGRRSFSFMGTRRPDGEFANVVRASQSTPVGPGWGWQVQTGDSATQRLMAGATLNVERGRFTGEATLGQQAMAVRLGASGAFGILAGMPFAARPIEDQAFAVVRVGELAGVPVYRDNQRAATTDRHGKALVTGLRPYEANHLRIAPEDLPFNVQIGALGRTVIPEVGAGVLVDIPVRTSRNALVSLIRLDGSPVPIGAEVSTNAATFPVGLRGEVYLTDLQDRNRLVVRWAGGSCVIDVTWPAGGGVEPRIGPLICGGKP